MANLSERAACRILQVPRCSMHPLVRPRRPAVLDELLVLRIERLISMLPTFGYRRLWAMLRFREGIRVNRKAVYRILKLKKWLVHERRRTPRPRVKGNRSRAEASNQRWAMDVTHIDCGRDGWAHLAVVIDCHDREVIGYEFALRGRAKEAERALEEACTEWVKGLTRRS